MTAEDTVPPSYIRMFLKIRNRKRWLRITRLAGVELRFRKYVYPQRMIRYEEWTWDEVKRILAVYYAEKGENHINRAARRDHS
jgi:hypothetical protein